MQRGSVEIRSGRWDWVIGDIISLTDGGVERKTLHLYDPKNPNNDMMVRLDPNAEPLSQSTIEELAQDFVETRSVQDTDGMVWRVTIGRRHGHIALAIPLDYEEIPHPEKLLVFKTSEPGSVKIFKAKPAKSVDFKSELNLGELTNDELLDLIRT